jgi:heme/copper-type cytochrome/quinol oxidase subunit 2
VTLTGAGIVVGVCVVMGLVYAWYADLLRQARREGYHREIRIALIAGAKKTVILWTLVACIWVLVLR